MLKPVKNKNAFGRNQGQADLIGRVIDKNRCASCGACVGHCPYLGQHNGRIVVRDRCTLERGRCFAFCPMTGAGAKFPGELGQYRHIMAARASRPEFRRKGQYGGVISALAWLAMKEGLIREAVMTSGGAETSPEGVRVKNKTAILTSAKTRFTASGVVAALNRALNEPESHPLGMVGVPCQIKAASAMRQAPASEWPFRPERIALLLGLFCTWALDHRKLSSYLRFMLFGERATGYDIPPPPADVFKVYTSDGVKAFPLEEIRPFRLEACNYCDDLTSAQADISVGAAEGLEGWNTIIVRTPMGRDLFDLAMKKNVLKVMDYPGEDLEGLKEAARGKKERGILAWEGKGARP